MDSVAPAPTPPDGTLGGYLQRHDRPPAFEGSDGHPYTVSIEVERVSDLRAPFRGYLVFPRWAANGLGVIGHLETPTLTKGATHAEAEVGLEALELGDLKALLEDALSRRASEP